MFSLFGSSSGKPSTAPSASSSNLGRPPLRKNSDAAGGSGASAVSVEEQAVAAIPKAPAATGLAATFQENHELSTYLVDNIRGRTPYGELMAELVQRCENVTNAKTFLTYVREASFYAPSQPPLSEFLQAMMKCISSLPDRDVERKIVRTCVHNILEMLSRHDVEMSMLAQRKEILYTIITGKEIKHGNLSRAILGWRTYGQLAVILRERTMNVVEEALVNIVPPPDKSASGKLASMARRQSSKEIEEAVSSVCLEAVLEMCGVCVCTGMAWTFRIPLHPSHLTLSISYHLIHLRCSTAPPDLSQALSCASSDLSVIQ